MGPEDADYLFIGEAPGKVENTKKLPFQGSTGREVREHYLPLAGLRPENVRITNAIWCLPVSTDGRLDSNRRQDLEILDSCTLAHLYPEIEAIRPKLIIPMGVFACKAIDPDIKLDLHHGMPMETAFGTVFPMFHPAGGVHEPKKMLMIRTDWVRLRRYILGKLVVPVDEYPDPVYHEANKYDICGIDPRLDMACDTESSKVLGPYVLTYSQKPGTGFLIKAGDAPLLELFQEKLNEWDEVAFLIFHNWMYDQAIVKRMGLRFPDKNIRDTMILAFHLGNLPQALKVLAFRLLGMQMQDFEDLVIPYSRPQVIEYYEMAKMVEWPKPEEELKRIDTGLWKLYKPQNMATKFKRFFTDFEKNPNKDVFQAWNNWEKNHEGIEDKLGPFPGLDIAHVPFDEMKHYACRDSDATLRLWPVLDRMRQKAITMVPQENWDI